MNPLESIDNVLNQPQGVSPAMYQRTTILSLIVPCLLTVAASASRADTVYDFGSVTGSATPLTINGATFSSPSDPGAFTFGPNAGLFSTLGSTVLSSAGVPATLDIAFATAQTGITFDAAVGDFFSSLGNDAITLSTNTGFTETVTAAIPSGSGDFYPQTMFSLAGAKPFTSVVIAASDGSPSAPEALVIADLTSSPVPLPAAVWMLLSGLGGGLLFFRRTRSAG
jgi:hypothetical protein